MKISINQPDLLQALSFTHKVLPSKPQLPILSAVLLSVAEDHITVSATDLFMGITVQVDAGIEAQGVVALPGKELKALIQSLPAEFLQLQFVDGTVTIRTRQTTVSLQTQNPEDFPEFPSIESELVTIPVKTIEKMVVKGAFAASSDTTRPVLTTFLWRNSEAGFEVVTTDGFRLSWQLFDGIEALADTELLIPAKALSEIVSIAKQVGVENIELQFDTDAKQLVFHIGTVKKFVRLIDGAFPPFEKIMPTSFATTVSFDRSALVDTLKRAMIFGKDSSQIVNFAIKEDTVEITASSPTLGSFVDVLSEVNVTGDEGEIAFNTKYLLDYLQAIDSETVIFKMNESLKPALFIESEDAAQKYVAMPFRMAG